jgi:hypothetical protein
MSEVLHRAALNGNARGTVASWIADRVGSRAKPGDELDLFGARLSVRRIRRGRVFEATVQLAAPPGRE